MTAATTVGANRANAAAEATNAVTEFISVAEKGAANGVATLDTNGKIPMSQVPLFPTSTPISVQADRAGARIGSPTPIMLGSNMTRIVSGVEGASELREQDDIVWDPDDPNLDMCPEREFKFYFTAVIEGLSRIYVAFSSDGSTFTAPVRCVMDKDDRPSEDPNVTQSLVPRGKVYRDTDGLLYLYVEDKLSSTIFAYSSADGVDFSVLAGNPAIPKGPSGTWDGYLAGSPIARHDGTQFLIGYEGVEGTNSSTTRGIDGAPGPFESFGLAYGKTANSLTKSPSNPSWPAGTEPLVGSSLVVDSFFFNDDQSAFIFTAHNGRLNDLPKWTTLRGITKNMNPLTWKAGDIAGFGGSVDHNYLFDFTVDHSHQDMSRIITQHGGGGGFVSRALAKVPVSYGVPLAIWLDASSETQYTDGALLTSLTDRSGNDRHAVASGSPTYASNVVGGKPVYRFGATTSADHADSQAFNLPVPVTAFVVANILTPEYVFDSASGQRAGFGVGVIRPGEIGFFNGEATTYASGPTSLPTGWHIWMIHTAGGPFENVIYRDGVIFARGPGAATTWTELRIGMSQTGVRGVVDIAEIGVATTALTLDRINRIGSRLAKKYSLSWLQVTD
ncbi:hypothetical protein [Arthrobacter sp. P2b]|uniref:hypothetical protein n=1 Tax=Arthrobacter sp. P2b TaxID=1938741 RepID=UPI001116F5CD|nr:hypothetical protein [Arthrobacter sp. P2b]